MGESFSQEKGEVFISWSTVNFEIYSKIFQDMINEAADQWLSENKVDKNERFDNHHRLAILKSTP